MQQGLSEKKLLLAWAAFFGLMFVPFAIALGIWTEIIEDEDVTDILAFLFLAATSYFSFRLIVTKVILSRNTQQKEDESCSVKTAVRK